MDEKPADPLEERRRWLADRVYVASERGWVLKSELTGDDLELKARRAWLNRMSSAFMSKGPVLERWSDKQWLRFLKEQRDAIDALITAEGRIRARGLDRPPQR
jgi:hypothetical protein